MVTNPPNLSASTAAPTIATVRNASASPIVYTVSQTNPNPTMRIQPRLAVILPALLAIPLLTSSPQHVAAQDVMIDEWVVPWDESRPRDPFVHTDGMVWFVGQRGDYAASFNPETRDFKKYELGEGAGPHNLVVAPNGIVWFAGNRGGYLGRLDPATGDIKKYPMPDAADRKSVV